MTRLLPILILPLGIALLEYHGIQFWTVAVTGAWPGWTSLGFAGAWSAWGIPVVLRMGAVWCWVESRAEGWRGGVWSFSGGVLTCAVCASVLLNVIAPTQTNQVVTSALEDERSRTDAREDATKAIVRQAVGPSGVPYSKPLRSLERTQERSVELFNEYMALAKAGKITSDGQGRLTLGLLVACMVLVELLVVAAARNVGQSKGAEDEGSDRDGNDVHPAGRSLVRHWLQRFSRQNQPLVVAAAVPADGGNEDESRLRTPPGPVAAAAVPPSHGDPPPAATDAGPDGAYLNGNGRAIWPPIIFGKPAPENREAAEAITENGENEPEAETPEPELTARVRKARQAVDSRFPEKTARERANEMGVSERDLSLLKNHEALTGKPGARIITERALAAIERAVGLDKPIPIPVPAPPAKPLPFWEQDA